MEFVSTVKFYENKDHSLMTIDFGHCSRPGSTEREKLMTGSQRNNIIPLLYCV